MSKPIKVIHIITGLGVGGAEQMLKRLLLSDEAGKNQTIIISLTGIGKIGLSLQSSGYQVYCFNFYKLLLSPLYFFFLIRLIRKYKPDIVHTWMDHANLIGGLAAICAGYPNILWNIVRTSSENDKKTTKFIMRFCGLLSYILPKKIACIAEAAKQSHIQFGYNEKKMSVIPCGLDFFHFNFQRVDSRKIREKLGLLSSELIIGCVGRFHPDKGQDILIEAASILKKTNKKDFQFILIGLNCDQNNKQLANLLNTWDLSSSFILLGEREDIPECLAAMDIFCMPSRTEGFPLGLAEAMSMGLPCVATDVGDVNFMIGEAALLVAPNSPSDLAAGLNRMIEMSFAQRKSLGQKALEQVRNNFSIDNVRHQYYMLYREIKAL